MSHPIKWCKHVNACMWKNCPFRHEPCEHYHNWVSNGKKGRNCRNYANSSKSPEEGGCKYDHRDVTNLKEYNHVLPCATEAALWDSFYDLGLEMPWSNTFVVSGMKKEDVSLLFRSLKSANLEFEDNDTWVKIWID